MADFLAVCEARNAWIVFDSSYMGEDYARAQLNKLLRDYSSPNPEIVFCYFTDTCSLRDFEPLSSFRDSLRDSEITKFLYNIPKSSLSNLFGSFVVEASTQGLVQIAPFKNKVLDSSCLGSAIHGLKLARASEDQKVQEKYLPKIAKVRSLYANPSVQRDIETVIQRIYLHPEHKFKTSMFDGEGKKIEDLYFRCNDWHPLEDSGAFLQIAIGAFGFNDYRAIQYIAFDRIQRARPDLEGRRDWRNIDTLMPDLISRRLDLLHLLSWMRPKGFDPLQLRQSLPIAHVIPGGIYFFETTFDDDLSFILDNFYPSVDYTLIED
jgi:hypothetical protein